MTSKFRLFSIAALVAIMCSLPACYTLLKHPRLASMDYQRPESTQCSGCHNNTEVWKFNHSNNIRAYAGRDGAWSEYYEIPWWYEHRWGVEPDAEHKKDKNENDSETNQ
jgi:hypothetical protein